MGVQVPMDRGGPKLLGRTVECEKLDELLSAVRSGRSGALVVRGEAGCGKSALLDYVAARSDGCRLDRAVGVESEMELPFAKLHQLCMPVLDRVERLPAPQREALGTSFGLSDGRQPDPFLVGLAVLTLLSEVAETQPLVCLVDDAHWLDHATALVLAFVARRLEAESILLVFAERDEAALDELAGLPELQLGGLSPVDARELLVSSSIGPIDERVLDRIVAESRGNPLALLELPRGVSSASLAGGFALPDSLPLASRIEASFGRRVGRLPDETQRLLLVGAAEPLGDPVLLWRAAAGLGIPAEAAAPAEAADLIEVGSRVTFRHPLLRSAIYRAASPDERRRAHGELAAATDPALDPDRRAWHRARATPGPDVEIAAELERSAGRAQSRGGLAAAAAFLTRATEMTPLPTQRVRRALDAALANVQAGAFDTARRLLTIARDGPIDELQRARIELVRAQLAFASSRGTEATPLLLAAARRLEAVDVGLARETYLDAFIAALLGTRANDEVGVLDVAQAARAAPRRSDGEPTGGELLLDAFSALTDDYETSLPPCRGALRKLCGDETAAERKPLWLWHGTLIALELWDDESWYVLSDRHLQIARKTGALSELPVALTSRVFALVFCGELAAAASLVEELRSLQEATGIGTPPYGPLMLAAWQGRAHDERELIEVTIRDARSRGEGIGVAVSDYMQAVLCNGSNQYEEALLAACRAAEDQRQLAAENWGLTELIESATRTGRTDLATDALNRLASKTRASGTDWALGIEARSRALLNEGDAEARFREAIEHLSRSRVRAELARAHLLYGEWLRREGRRRDAREHLRTAHDMLAAFGMEAFAKRARRELAATGETVRKRTDETRGQLTPQEQQIARLAADGHTNPEIGAQLFLSPRTVEWHLRKVFTKLDISSRRQLREALPSGAHAA